MNGITYFIVPSTFRAGIESPYNMLFCSDQAISVVGGELVQDADTGNFEQIFDAQQKHQLYVSDTHKSKVADEDKQGTIDPHDAAGKMTMAQVSTLCSARQGHNERITVPHDKTPVEDAFANGVLRRRKDAKDSGRDPAEAVNILFEDEEFPACAASIWLDAENPNTAECAGCSPDEIEWLRPGEIGLTPGLFKDGVDPGDVIQGSLSDCWILSSLSILAVYPEVLAKLFASARYGHLGLYVVRLYKNGAWITVIVDDRIPCKDGVPVFARCKDENEFWVMILEKAYAKVHHCYECLNGGEIDYGLRDLTGGLPDELDVQGPMVQALAKEKKLFPTINALKSSGHKVLLGCAIVAQGEGVEGEAEKGLLTNHAYSILQLKEIEGNTLLQLRNPWGKGEWQGDWSDNWDGWSEEAKKECKLVAGDDGTFWMNDTDFVSLFSVIYVCDILPDTWSAIRCCGEWKGESAGGCMNNKKTWSKNPAFKMIANTDADVAMHIVLTQPDARLVRGQTEYACSMGFVIYKSTNGEPKKKLKRKDLMYMSPTFKQDREVSGTMKLEPTKDAEAYYIVPSTFKAEQEGTFFLTIASDAPITMMNCDAEPEEALDSDSEGEELIAFSEGDEGAKEAVQKAEELKKDNFEALSKIPRHRRADQEDEYARLVKESGKGFFEDPDFLPEGKSLYFDPAKLPEHALPPEEVKWLRPKEIDGCETPELFRDGVSAGDIIQGNVNDCWILSALSILASHPVQLERLFVSTKYADLGMYVVQFFKNGRWKLIIVDDRIPCNEYGEPIYARCKDPNEIWVMILEKAYAKVHGCYEALGGGLTDYGLRDISGGEPSTISLRVEDAATKLWEEIGKSTTEGHILLLGCAIVEDGTAEFEGDAGNGLLNNHAYSVLKVLEYEDEVLLQVRNPWGRTEWQGAWSDYWDGWTNDAKKHLEWVAEDDGTFWMSLPDFVTNFTDVYVCDILPRSWKRVRLFGEWTDATAGGCLNFPTWKNNPQFRFTVEEPVTIIIVLSQDDARIPKENGEYGEWNDFNSFGFVLYCSSTGKQKKKIRKKDLVGMTGAFLQTRETSVRFTLQPTSGAYFIVPSTFEAEKKGKFFITVNSDHPVTFVAEDGITGGAEAVGEDGEIADNEVEDLRAVSGGELKGEEDYVGSEEYSDDQVLQEHVAKGGSLGASAKPKNTHALSELEEQFAKKCKDAGTLFTDPEFSASAKAIWLDPENPNTGACAGCADSEIQWLRPKDIHDCKDPGLFKDGVEPGDVVQGALSDCWILSSLSILAAHEHLLSKLFVSAKHADLGMYVMRFYKDGEWKYVIVDDRIPCNDEGTPIFARCKDPNETWVMILEKAYAKLHGCYEQLNGGEIDYGLRDITAGAPNEIDLKVYQGQDNKELWDMLMKMVRAKGHVVLMGCAIVSAEGGIEDEAGEGLLANHAYSLLQVSDQIQDTVLIQLRNPWGRGEWQGKWSDDWDGWEKNPRYKEALRYKNEDDGTFWMNSSDFMRYFSTLYLCDVIPENWSSVRTKSEWSGDSAGGCMNNKATWSKNPALKMSVTTKTSAIITLTQPDARFAGEKEWDQYQRSIGFVIYKSEKGKPKTKLKRKDLVTMTAFKQDREVSATVDLEPASANEKDFCYYIVPSTFEPGQESTFYISVVSELPVSITGGELLPPEEAPDDGDGLDMIQESLPGDKSGTGGLEAVKGLYRKTSKSHPLSDIEREIGERLKTSGELWEDPEFQPRGRALYYDPLHRPENTPDAGSVDWLRPNELARKPNVFCDGVEAGDVIQGALADCWILSALSIIACCPVLLESLFLSSEYADQGIYVMQFFKNGEWVPVMIDDRIPVDIVTGEPLYARCKDSNEMWVLILEKAYAKLHGCYEALAGGQTDYALRDFTGGIPMQFPVAGDGSGGGHWTQMSTKIGEGHKVLLGCASVNNAADIEAEMGLGILANHAYSILDMRSHSSQKLFRLRNPWGRVEWSGKFSDKWSGWTDELKKKLDWVDADDGMFWMCYDDLQQYFTHIYLCDVIPASWQSTRVAGYWRGESAGGCEQQGQLVQESML